MSGFSKYGGSTDYWNLTRSFDDFKIPTNEQTGTNRPRALQESNLLKSLPVDKDKANSVAKIKVVAGLLLEVPTEDLLYEYSRIVLNKNVENLYACGVNENEVYVTLAGAIPRIINWIKLFKHSQNSNVPVVDFGLGHGLKQVGDTQPNSLGYGVVLRLMKLQMRLQEQHVRSAGSRQQMMVVDIEEMAWAPKYGLKGMIDASVHVRIQSDGEQANEKVIPLEFKTGKSAMEHTAQVILYTLLMSERSDVVGLLIRRNELARDITRASMVQQLPPMLRAHGGNADSSGLGDIFDSLTSHLTNSHIMFLKQWDRLIDLEAKEVTKNNLWQSHVSKNEHSKSFLSSVVVDASDQLQMQNPTKDNRFVSFSKRLRLPKSSPSLMSRDIYQAVWRIDKDEFSTSFAIMRFNLVQLFLQSAQTVHLRKMIVDLEAPKFDSGCVLNQDPVVSYLWSVKHLNDDQHRAIIKAITHFGVMSSILTILTVKDYALILGMPGMGKTSTMVYAVKALLLRGASILLTSYTNTAVDNLLIKLKAEGIDFARIGRSEVVHKEVHEHCISALDIHSVEEIKMRLDLVKVVAVTCLGITSPLLSNRKFDVCIMDEVSLGPLMFASVFVLVGDHYQLPPLVQSPEARENGMGLSLFCRLSEAHPQAISALQSQYRMCAGIMNLSNALIYSYRLRCVSSEVENAKLQFSNSVSVPSWLKKASKQREAALEAASAEKEFAEEECRKKVDEAKKREASLENDLANMWVRKRPLNKKELTKNEENIIETNSNSLIVHETKLKVDLTEYVEKHNFVFDAMLNEEVSNDEVYRETVEPIVAIIFQLTKATYFAYGQTAEQFLSGHQDWWFCVLSCKSGDQGTVTLKGSGKTYTMKPLPLKASRDILRLMHHTYRNRGFQLFVNFFEIYAENLLISSMIEKYRESDVEIIKELIQRRNATRSTGTTGANEESSRSYAILQLAMKRSADGTESKPPRVVGKLSFIDLAGSERGADPTDNDKQTSEVTSEHSNLVIMVNISLHRIEGGEINKSLLALKECIRALDNDQNHIPFRGSKLTEVLRDSFVGNSRTVMISCISPSSGYCERTLNTLRYANRVKSLSKGNNSKKDILLSMENLKESTTLPISSVLPTLPSLKDDASDAWSQQIQGEDYEVSEESYEQVKLPSKKITLEDKMRKANGQTKWKDLLKIDPKNIDSDDDLNDLLKKKILSMLIGDKWRRLWTLLE
ncbi:hypothetical protein Ancab_012165, partial [Ancistrocladus abbreviatus]